MCPQPNVPPSFACTCFGLRADINHPKQQHKIPKINQLQALVVVLSTSTKAPRPWHRALLRANDCLSPSPLVKTARQPLCATWQRPSMRRSLQMAKVPVVQPCIKGRKMPPSCSTQRHPPTHILSSPSSPSSSPPCVSFYTCSTCQEATPPPSIQLACRTRRPDGLKVVSRPTSIRLFLTILLQMHLSICNGETTGTGLGLRPLLSLHLPRQPAVPLEGSLHG